jgi:hypothetical protein
MREARVSQYKGEKVIPFSDELSEASCDGPVVFYGSVRWMGKIHESGMWTPGVFFNDHFNYVTCRDRYGDHFLNWDCEVTTLREMAENKSGGYYFVRPVADDKSFSGAVIHRLKIKEWVGKLMACDIDMYSIPVVISIPKIISHEWRMFMVDGKVSSGSIYKRYGVLYVKDPVPDEVVFFAEKMAERFSPDRVFALDICREKDHEDLKVLEVGCFNSAGFYNSDIDVIVRSVSELSGVNMRSP